uniref:Uncharacterized protein n=1 Tax=Anguilla anguilla TaxID=7936 RepID=A0A0E9RDC7_ANGAN
MRDWGWCSGRGRVTGTSASLCLVATTCNKGALHRQCVKNAYCSMGVS